MTDSQRHDALPITSMFFIQKLNTNEIAKALNVSEACVANRMYFARRIWRDWLMEAA